MMKKTSIRQFRHALFSNESFEPHDALRNDARTENIVFLLTVKSSNDVGYRVDCEATIITWIKFLYTRNWSRK